MKVWRASGGMGADSFQTLLGFLLRFWAKPKMKTEQSNGMLVWLIWGSKDYHNTLQRSNKAFHSFEE